MDGWPSRAFANRAQFECHRTSYGRPLSRSSSRAFSIDCRRARISSTAVDEMSGWVAPAVCRPSGERAICFVETKCDVTTDVNMAIEVTPNRITRAPTTRPQVTHRPGRSTVDRKVSQLDVGMTLHPGHRATGRAPATGAHGLDVDLCFPARAVLSAEELDGKSDQPGRRARRVCLHGGPPSLVLEQPQTGGALWLVAVTGTLFGDVTEHLTVRTINGRW